MTYDNLIFAAIVTAALLVSVGLGALWVHLITRWTLHWPPPVAVIVALSPFFLALFLAMAWSHGG